MATKRRPSAPSKKTPSSSIPAGFSTVTPYLAIEGAAAALEFYKRAFGAKETRRQATPDGKIIHARLKLGDSIVMLSDVFPGGSITAPSTLGTSTVTLHIYSEDVDRLWSRALQAGAKVAMPLENQFWGERYGQVIDPFGHRWSMAQVVRMSKVEKKALEEQAMAMFSAGQHPASEGPTGTA